MHGYRKNYPRPQLVREDWELLDGDWGFAFDDAAVGEREGWQAGMDCPFTIRVPYTYETKLSGIGDESAHNVVWYQRQIRVDREKLTAGRLLLHFEGVDFKAKVWINGKLAGTHMGGYARFSFDITELVQEGENLLTVRAEDSFDTGQPRGKQRWKAESYACWYVQTTGIWKSVWMEYVGQESVEQLKITPLWREKAVELEAEIRKMLQSLPKKIPEGSRESFTETELTMEVRVSFDGRLIRKGSCQVTGGGCRIRLDLDRPDLFEWGIQEWKPGSPNLYDVELCLLRDGQVCDKVSSYFGLREIRIDGANILLNGSPLYQRLILDQGYWEASHLTPPDEEALIRDIDSVIAMGYNGVRKHQKIEDERFLYWCDVKGLLVWSEMAAAYQYSDRAVEEFTKEWMEIVQQNYSHPCIITWTLFNESWGVDRIRTCREQQHFTEAIYHLTKAIDPYRPVIVNDGWEHTVSDILTLHDYEESGEVLFRRYSDARDGILDGSVYHCGHHGALAEGYAYHGQPVIISEYGGIAFRQEEGWGYGNMVAGKEEFIRRFDEVTTAIKRLPYVCGFCYTQVSDVQQEVNGLMDAARNYKVKPEIIREINERVVEPEYKAGK